MKTLQCKVYIVNFEGPASSALMKPPLQSGRRGRFKACSGLKVGKSERSNTARCLANTITHVNTGGPLNGLCDGKASK